MASVQLYFGWISKKFVAKNNTNIFLDSFGEMPYRDIEIYQLKRHILNGHTLEKPPYANDNMYVLIITRVFT